MLPFIRKISVNLPDYLGCTFDKQFTPQELSNMQSGFKEMAETHIAIPNLNSACNFMRFNLLKHNIFTTYLVNQTASLGTVVNSYNKRLFLSSAMNIDISATCLYSKREFIRFTTKGQYVAGLWVKSTRIGNIIYLNHDVFNIPLNFNTDLNAFAKFELKYFGDSKTAQLQSHLPQLITHLKIQSLAIN